MRTFREAEDEHEIRRRNMARGFFRPFNQADGIVAKILAQTSIDKLFRDVETIKIKVIPVYARNYVNFNQRIGRAFHRPGMSQRSQQGTNQGRLPRAEVAIKPDHHAGSQQRRQLPPKRNRCRLIR